MRIDNTFVVPAAPEQAWEFLTDLERVTPCLPGASVDSMEGETLSGKVALRIGPMNLTYAGTAKFVVKDDLNMVATIEAGGRDGRGAGSVSARIRASLAEVSDGTEVSLSTDLDLTGRVAQLGRGPINDVSAKLMAQFAACLSARIGEAQGGPVAVGVTERSAGRDQEAVVPIDLLATSSVPIKAVGTALGAIVAAALLILLGRRLGRKRTH